MSSLRIGSLRLCWLESFIAVADCENISEAARGLHIDQSTVSRHIISLEKWLGENLVELGAVSDPQNPRAMMGTTDKGHDFYDIAKDVIEFLRWARTDKVEYKDIIKDIKNIIGKMQSDLKSENKFKTAETHKNKINNFQNEFDKFSESSPMPSVRSFYYRIRKFHLKYEKSINLEKRERKKLMPPPDISAEWFQKMKLKQNTSKN